jgi:hypothetical protein
MHDTRGIMNLPLSWNRMTTYAKLCYLVNTHQARDFAHAGKLLNAKKQVKKIEMPKIIRLPYADN